MRNLKHRINNYLGNSTKVLGINERNVSLIYPNNERKYYKLADDKVLTKTILETHCIDCAKTYAVIERIGDIQAQWQAINRYDKIAIKPANGSGGGGIKILRKNDKNQWCSGGQLVDDEQIFLHMASIIMGRYSLGSDDRVLIEECIEPHPFFHEIYPEGVPDFRVILLNEKPLMAMLRVPTDESDGKANLHQGGLGIGIDMKKGKLQLAYNGKQYFESHPDNNNNILGKRIPYWEHIIAVSLRVAKHFPLQYLGVDIVIDKDKGPLIMEVNVRPGLGIQLANQQGMKKMLK
ncbi:MAG: alpha-L-glutamate ligase-like protein [Winogradskyella sp.]|uniref:sugar-transfer associated ATP-grasp domain-containing protein n=1 Tax=Winogradskyella sp. TaxID=1883156 RepID=UPI0025F726C6|nr:sugar-transfer associated ATP-grasp domain-containing protein [Winogradskyella sp.]NRB59617.1 alpha-L-glutamate ligase-like protein [Winogradskyella sp.]